MQRLKRAIKKIATIGVGAAMLGATITSAVALDLAEYPVPFIVNGEYDNANAIVVGEAAASSDTLGAVDIAARMQFDAKKPVSTPGGTLSVTGGVTEDIPLGYGIANSTSIALDWELDDSDISSFMDTSVMFQGEDYDIHDGIVLQTEALGGPSVETSLTGGEDDYETGVFMHAGRKGIHYFLAFDDPIIPSNATTTEPLEIKFLGKTLKITKVDKSKTMYEGTGDADESHKFTAYIGNEYFMKVGDSITVDSKKFTLENVGSGGSIVVDVDGTLETIPAETTETVNGIEIANDETFYEDTKSERSASLVIGIDAQGTFEHGDPFIGQDEADPDWKWFVKNLYTAAAYTSTINRTMDGGGPVIGIYNDFIINDANDNPPGIGECIDLPNNYASICLDSLTVSDEDYLTVTIEVATNEDTTESNHPPGESSVDLIKISAPGNERFVIPANSMQHENGTLNENDVKTSTVWLQAETSTGAAHGGHAMVYYHDKDHIPTMRYIGNISASEGALTSQGFLRLNYGDTKDSNICFNLSMGSDNVGQATEGTTNNWIMMIDVNGDSTTELQNVADNIYINFTNSTSGGVSEFSSLGGTVSKEEAGELHWGKGFISHIGEKDEDHRTAYGIIIKDPKSNGGSDSVVLEIPKDQVQVNVVVKGQATTVVGGAISYVPAKIDVNPMLDSDVTSPTAHNLVLVGGPVVNTLTASFVGSDWILGSGEALIKLVTNGDKVALVIAGTDAIDTRMACKVLANYEDYNLETTEQIITGTISAPTIKTA